MKKKKLSRLENFIEPSNLKKTNSDPLLTPLQNKTLYRSSFMYRQRQEQGHARTYKSSICMQPKRSIIFGDVRQKCICKKQTLHFFCIVPNLFWYSNCKTSYTIVRPLLNSLRSTITMGCISTDLPIYPDLSNLTMKYSRNRIRTQIVPTIKFFFNPKIEKTLFKFSECFRRRSF